MNPAAIKKSKHRLEKAKTFLSSTYYPTYNHFVSDWTDFLLALNSVYSCLEQGSKVNPTNRQWFGKKKRERRQDPLLQYLHQARNADEHGLAPVSKRQPPIVKIADAGDGGTINSIEVEDDKIIVDYDDTNGRVPLLSINAPFVVLITVKNDLFGDSFDPPTEHLGQPLEDNHPLTVAKLGIAYVESLIQEAEGLV